MQPYQDTRFNLGQKQTRYFHPLHIASFVTRIFWVTSRTYISFHVQTEIRFRYHGGKFPVEILMPSPATRRKMDRHQASFKSRLRGAFSREKSRNSPKLFGKNNTDGFHRRIFRVERERNMKHSTGGSTQGSAIPA